MQLDDIPMEILAAAMLASRTEDGHAGQQDGLCPVLSWAPMQLDAKYA